LTNARATSAHLRIGIDVGGTNTDAVVLDDRNTLLTWTKSATTPDISTGVERALDTVLESIGGRAASVDKVMLGTTHGVNAVLERRHLCRVGAIRLGAPATTSIPPLESWPRDLRDVVLAGSAIVPGGNFFSGTPISSPTRESIERFVEEYGDTIETVAITGVFSPAYREQELEAAEIVASLLGNEIPISLSHEIGSLGLLSRENATVLNAALFRAATEVTSALTHVLERRNITAATYLAQNDGTLMGLEFASRYPVLTIGSGPANSIRGAAFLSGLEDAVVVDVGGTSTDFGVLAGGFPRESALGTEIGGVRTNFRLPDILSLGIGGGTIVTSSADGPVVGPHSVGYRLAEHALCFGGDTMTLTDAAVSARRATVGQVMPDKASADVLAAALSIADERIADGLDRMSLGNGIGALVVVGGASFLVRNEYVAVKSVVQPEHGAVANAVGAAIAPVSARWDTIIPAGSDRRRAIDEACAIATSRAIRAGAAPESVEIVEVTEVPIGYLLEPAVRLRVRAAGPIGTLS
jgi:N-methylhydantoinase A/oxoprolinase/acetone carboxylase beta subunit